MRKYYNKKFIIAVLLLAICFTVEACDIQDDSDSVAIQHGSSSNNNKQEEDYNEENEENGENEEIQIYTMDPDSLETEEVTMEMDASDELTAQMIVDQVLYLFEMQGQDVEVNQVEQDENVVIVDFNGEKAPVSNVGSAEETAILDCISMSLLDNLKECQQVVFHVDGERYESGHYEFELNEAYKWKS